MKSAYLCLLVCCLVGIAWCGTVGNPGVDRPYGDLPNMPLQLDKTAVAQDCLNKCSGEAACKAWAFSPPNCKSNTITFCWLKAEVMSPVPDTCLVSGTKDNTLLPRKNKPFPVGSIQPLGWLKNQLNVQAKGLCGYLSQFWPSISQSAWIGHPGGDAFERVPYWLNGIVPLAFQTNDPSIVSQMHNYLDYILSHQSADGWIGPACIGSGCDPWPRFPMLLALIQYSEANSSDTRIVPAVWKFMTKFRSVIEANHLSSWAQYRVHDLILVIQWLYDNHPQGQEQFLYDLSEYAYKQGFDWGNFFAGSNFPEGPCTGSCVGLATHGVNNGQALKSGAVWYRQSKSQADVDSSYQRIKRLYQYHGQASGIFNCDEHLGGNMPSHGSELCTVVETMFSYEEMYSILGDPYFGGLIEKLAFNALPATLTPDMWAHQYLQQANEINAAHVNPHIYTTDGPDSNIYGLEPNFGCCTANFPQGWPKFASRLYLQTSDHGVLAALYSPSALTTTINGNKLSIQQTTDYPFGDSVSFDVTAQSGFNFYLRIPDWAVNATVQVGNAAPTIAKAGAHFLVKLNSGQSKVTLKLPMSWSVERRYNNAASLHYGPLLFAMNIPAQWTVLKKYSFQSTDLQALPSGPWAFALDIADKDVEKYLKVSRKPVGELPFSEAGSPITVTANARPIQWDIASNAAMAPPKSPVSSSAPSQTVTLLPFGATKLRILEIPTLN